MDTKIDSFESFCRKKAQEKKETTNFAMACRALSNFIRITTDHHSGEDAAKSLKETANRIAHFRRLTSDEYTKLYYFVNGLIESFNATEPLCICMTPSCEKCATVWKEYEEYLESSNQNESSDCSSDE